jgi:hypothetical protein
MKWSDEDRGKAMAFLVEEGLRCQMCGTAPWEWDLNPFAYEPASHFCRGCYLKDTHSKDGNTLEGTTTTLVPSDSISWIEREKQMKWERQQAADRAAEDS